MAGLDEFLAEPDDTPLATPEQINAVIDQRLSEPPPAPSLELGQQPAGRVEPTPQEIAVSQAQTAEQIEFEPPPVTPEGLTKQILGIPGVEDALVDLGVDLVTAETAMVGGGASATAAAQALPPGPIKAVGIPIAFLAGAMNAGMLANQFTDPIKQSIKGEAPTFTGPEFERRAEEGAMIGGLGTIGHGIAKAIPIVANAGPGLKAAASKNLARFLGVKSAKQLDDTTLRAVDGLVDDGYFDSLAVATQRQDLAKKLGSKKGVDRPPTALATDAKSLKEFHKQYVELNSGILDAAIDRGDVALRAAGAKFQVLFSKIENQIAEEISPPLQAASLRRLNSWRSRWENGPQTFAEAQRLKRLAYEDAKFNVTGVESVRSKTNRFFARELKEQIENNYRKFVGPDADNFNLVSETNQRLGNALEVSGLIDDRLLVDRFKGPLRQFLRNTENLAEARAAGKLGFVTGGAIGGALTGTQKGAGIGAVVGGALGTGATAVVETPTARLATAQLQRGAAAVSEKLSRSIAALTDDPTNVETLARLLVNSELLPLLPGPDPVTAENESVQAAVQTFNQLDDSDQRALISQLAALQPEAFEPTPVKGFQSIIDGRITDEVEKVKFTTERLDTIKDPAVRTLSKQIFNEDGTIPDAEAVQRQVRGLTAKRRRRPRTKASSVPTIDTGAAKRKKVVGD